MSDIPQIPDVAAQAQHGAEREGDELDLITDCGYLRAQLRAARAREAIANRRLERAREAFDRAFTEAQTLTEEVEVLRRSLFVAGGGPGYSPPPAPADRPIS